MELFEVLWQQEDATSMLPSIAEDARTGQPTSACDFATRAGSMSLAKARKADDGQGRRERHRRPGSLISRIHARIEIARTSCCWWTRAPTARS